MAEYIKKEDVLKLLEKNSITKKITLADGISIYESVKNAPTADAVEVKYGHWIEDEVCVYACSECGFIFTTADDISEFKFCRCGAKMDGKE